MIKRLLVVGLAALALARPETYKENEEFNYARSSTDEGSKSGFYEAQRGNVGGNYERAHNMDYVAQGQMSDIVNQVGGQVKEVSSSKQGDVFGSAYSRGVYGQRHYDTSNLAGRNFGENSYSGTGHSSNSASSSLNSAASSASRYQQYGGTTRGAVSDNLNAGSALQTDAYGSGYQSGYGSRQHSSSGYQQSSGSSHQSSSNSELYDQNHINSDVSNQYRIVPVRISVRPAVPVRIPVKATANQEIVDSSYRQTNEDQSRTLSQNRESSGVYNGGLNTGSVIGVVPSNKEKHSESAYTYHKEWERNSGVTPVPLAIPVSNPQSGSLVDYTYDQRIEQNRQNQYRREHSSHSQSNTASNAESVSANQADLNNRGYQSGYQYQRVAEPLTNRYVVLSPTPEFVVTGTKSGGAYRGSSSHLSSGYTSGSRSESRSAYGDESLDQGHLQTNNDNLLAASSHNHDALVAITGTNGNSGTNGASGTYGVPGTNGISGANGISGNSYGTDPKNYQSSYSYHKSWERQGDPYIIKPASSGPVKSGALVNYPSEQYAHGSRNARYSTHHSHTSQDDCDDEHQRYTRSSYGYGGQHQISEDRAHNIQEDLGQQTEDLTQQTEEFGQQTMDLTQQTEDFGQQTQDLTQQTEDFGQQTQDLTQQTEDLGQKMEDLTQKTEAIGQYTQGHHQGTTDTSHGQQIQEQAVLSNEDMGQQVQLGWGNSENLEQQVQSGWDQSQLGQESEDIWTEYVPPIQNGARDLAHSNVGKGKDHTSYSHLENGKHSDENGNNNMGTPETTTTIQPIRKQNDDKNVNKTEETDDIEAINVGTILRGDLGSENSVGPTTTTTSYSKSHTAEEYDEHLRALLSAVNTDKGDSKTDKEESAVSPVFISKEKTPEEIEVLSLMRDTDKLSTNQYGVRPASIRDNEKEVNQMQGSYNLDKTVKQIDQNNDYGQQTEYLGQEVEGLDKKIENEDQHLNNAGFSNQETNNFGTIFNEKQFTHDGQHVESFGKNKENEDQQRESFMPIYNQQSGSIQQNHHRGFEVTGAGYHREPQNIGANLQTSEKEVVDLENHEKVYKNTQDMIDFLRELSNGSTQAQPNTNKPLESSQRDKTDSNHYAQKPKYYGSHYGYTQEAQQNSSEQQTENIGQEVEGIKEQLNAEDQRPESTVFANQETDNFGSTFNQHQSEYDGQQLESFEKNKENEGQQRENSMSIYNQESDSIGQNYNQGVEVIGARYHGTPKDMGQNIQTSEKEVNNQENLENINKNTQDMIDFLRQLHNAQENTKPQPNTHKPLGSSLRDQTKPNSYAQGPRYVSYGYAQEEQRFQQKSENISQQAENIDEIALGQETVNLDQQSTDFGQQRENLNWQGGQQTYLDQQTQDFGQQVETLDSNVESIPQRYSELGQQSDDLGQQVQSFDQMNKAFITTESTQRYAGEVPQENIATHYSNLDHKPKHSENEKVVGLDEKKDDLSSNLPTNTTSQPESESPSFWKTVGNKFSNAKDKVSCWFGKC